MLKRRRQLAERGIQGTVSVEQRNSYDEENTGLLEVERTERLLCWNH